MTVDLLIAEASEFTAGSVRFAREIDQASTGETLGGILNAAKKDNPGAYVVVQEAVNRRVSELGGAGEAIGLFMLAADMATTESVARSELTGAQRSELRQLWNDLLAQR